MGTVSIINKFIGREIEVIFLSDDSLTDDPLFKELNYIQYSRSSAGREAERIKPGILEIYKKAYIKKRNHFTKLLVKEIGSRADFDILICAPSTQSNFNKPYFNAIKTGFRNTILKDIFEKNISAGETPDFHLYYKNFSLKQKTGLIAGTYKNALIVDDVYAEGKTIAAIVLSLEQIEIKIVNIHVAVPLLISS